MQVFFESLSVSPLMTLWSTSSFLYSQMATFMVEVSFENCLHFKASLPWFVPIESDSDFFSLSWSYLNPKQKSTASNDHGNEVGEDVFVQQSSQRTSALSSTCSSANECLKKTSSRHYCRLMLQVSWISILGIPNHTKQKNRSWTQILWVCRDQLFIVFLFFYYSMNFITFTVLQWSSQPNFIAFPSQNPSASPQSRIYLIWKPYVFQSLWVSICSAKNFIVSFF